MIRMDHHICAIEWLEKHLDVPTYQFDVDDVRAMVEQVTYDLRDI